MRFAPFLLDPSVRPEGREQPPHKPGAGPTYMQERAAKAGLTFTSGRTWRSSSHLSLEAAEFAAEQGHDGTAFHRAMFTAYFGDLADIGDVDTVVRIGGEAGLAETPLREALESGRYRDQVDESVRWARFAGVSSVPTFIFNEEYAIVGAQEYDAFEQVMATLGREKRPAD